ncbi:hypothetical protein [Chitinilyticum piscinae]|uniref:Uncharacterized protein n=1 Tax=Chitinilyticum piscinae TaxID=2866724 RepID=A0A8J7FKC1_9NEIS|nr:hypothetical protein [Chitinilyticum piscinae]MBE9609267.1 hypothetical protein [Chitinilyticum piscinae]
MSRLLLSLLLAASLPAFAGNPDTEVHTWYAGTTFSGTVNTFGLSWQCSGGTCQLTGPYGRGLNMKVCRELARQVGPLEYYYNDAGMTWSKSENAALLKQCNAR